MAERAQKTEPHCERERIYYVHSREYWIRAAYV